MPGPKRVVMHFVYRKVRADQINETWDEDFKNNLSDEERQRLAAKIEAFKSFFGTFNLVMKSSWTLSLVKAS